MNPLQVPETESLKNILKNKKSGLKTFFFYAPHMLNKDTNHMLN